MGNFQWALWTVKEKNTNITSKINNTFFFFSSHNNYHMRYLHYIEVIGTLRPEIIVTMDLCFHEKKLEIVKCEWMQRLCNT